MVTVLVTCLSEVEQLVFPVEIFFLRIQTKTAATLKPNISILLIPHFCPGGSAVQLNRFFALLILKDRQQRNLYGLSSPILHFAKNFHLNWAYDQLFKALFTIRQKTSLLYGAHYLFW